MELLIGCLSIIGVILLICSQHHEAKTSNCLFVGGLFLSVAVIIYYMTIDKYNGDYIKIYSNIIPNSNVVEVEKKLCKNRKFYFFDECDSIKYIISYRIFDEFINDNNIK